MSTATATEGNAFSALWSGVRWGRFVFWLITGVVLMGVVLFALNSLEQFLIKDSRFRLSEADPFGGQSPDLIVEGTQYASSAQIRHLFREDFGRSLYLVPITKRREQLLAIDWVEDAAVQKIWPKTLKVQVKERVPVAFVHLPPNAKDGMWRYALIDRDGFVLRPRVAAKFTLPVITGIHESEPIEDRKARVVRVMALLNDVGTLAKTISEVDVSDPNNLIVSDQFQNDGVNTVVNLWMGDENYQERLQNFVNNFSAIHQKRPDVSTMDLRVDGVITAVGEDKVAHKK